MGLRAGGWVGVLVAGVSLVGAGCATTAAEEQQRARVHQKSSDDAARRGQYGVAGDEQRQAQEAQNKATMKSIDEGSPVARVPGEAVPPGSIGRQQEQ